MKTLTNPHELLASVPFLIGYHPSDSIVFVALRNGSAGVAMRVDYPSEPNGELIKILIDHLRRQQADEVAIMIYQPDESAGCDEITSLAQELLGAAKIPIAELICIKGKRWRSLLCRGKNCCPPEGRPLASSLSSDLSRKISVIPEIDYSLDDFQRIQQQGALAINDLIEDFLVRDIRTSLDLVALALVRLRDLQVRDYALGVANDELQSDLLRLWGWIVSIAPRGYVAPPATLYAELAYENGEKSMALRALERALDDEPAYELARLLRRTFATQWPVENFKSMRAQLHPKICASLFGQELKG